MYPQIELVDGATGYVIGELHQGEVWEAHPRFRCTEPGTYVDAIKLTWGGTNYGTWITYINIVATAGGIDTIGVYDPAAATFFLRNSNSAGVADLTFNYGIPNWVPIVGDWDGDGIDTIGAYNPATATFFLRNSNSAGVADITFNYGIPNWVPIVGDWDGDGIDTIGVYNPATATFFLRDSNSAGVADLTFNYGIPNWTPLAGDWDGNGASASSALLTVTPDRTEALQVSCAPNPLREEGSIVFKVTGAADVQTIRVKVYNLTGELVWQSEAEGNALSWGGDDLAGQPLANGVYLYVVEVKVAGKWTNLGIDKLLILR